MFTINKILEIKKEDLKNTVYEGFSKQVLNFKMSAVDSFELKENIEDRRNFKSWIFYERRYVEKLNQEEYINLEKKLENIKEKIQLLKQKEKELYKQTGIIPEVNLELKEYHRQKKVIKEKIEQTKSKYEQECKQECFKLNEIPGKNILYYKKTLMLNSYEDIQSMFPFLPNGTQIPLMTEMPLYTSDLSLLQEKVKKGEEIAVEGGPCLFGVDEVYIKITCQDGSVYFYDYNTGHRHENKNDEEMNLEEYMENFSKQIVEVNFINKKKGLTIQEYYELLYPFIIAKAFHAKLVIPLPDMSYIKYLSQVMKKLDSKIFEQGITRFKKIVFAISDMHLNKIKEIADLYPEVPYQIVHERDQEICQKYYQIRHDNCQRSKSRDIIKSVTRIECRQQSIFDYVTMPALPYYLYGIKNIIQIDCMNEVDSYRKCCQIHNNRFNLFAILYPEYISKDGEHTVFNAKVEDKDYL